MQRFKCEFVVGKTGFGKKRFGGGKQGFNLSEGTGN